MRWIRLLSAMIVAKFRSKIDVRETSSMSFRVWFTDIDVAIMNHAAILTVMEMGRLDYMIRSGIFSVVNKKKWSIPGKALTVEYYRPLKFFQKGELHSKIAYIDEKWVYMEQKITRNGKDVAFCLIKAVIKKRSITIPPTELMKAMGISEFNTNKSKLLETFEATFDHISQHEFDNESIL